MKKSILLLALVMGFVSARADKKEVEIESEINSVTVFLRGAQVERSAKQFLKPGVYTLKFTGLTQRITEGSVQVNGKGDLTILSVSKQINYNQNTRVTPELQILLDSLEMLQNELSFQRELKKVFSEEKSMILVNKKIDYGEQMGFAIEDIEDMADFFRTRLKEIMRKQLQIAQEEKALQEDINRINGKIGNIRQGNQRTSEVLVEVAVSSNTPAEFALSYSVPDAGWSASYNVRAKDLGKPVELSYNAKVFQRTGVDWENVNMTLSTSDPSVSAQKPTLRTWLLRFITPNKLLAAPSMSNRRFDMEDDAEEEAGEFLSAEPAGLAYQWTSVQESQLNVKYSIELPYDIPSDGKTHTVNIRKENLKSEYEYYSAPKLNQSAFLLARVSGWEELNLLPGPANIYFEGTFVGTSYINTQNTEKTLDLSLGIDKQVIVTRKRIKDYSETKVIGSKKKETIGLAIEIKNTKSRPIKLRVQDQIPVSSDKDIEVEAEEFVGGAIKNETGIVSWELELAPAENKRHELKYNVKYPKDKKINL